MEQSGHFDPPISNNNHLEHIFNASTFGEGHQVVSIATSPEVLAIVDQQTFVSDILAESTQVFLTPGKTRHVVDPNPEIIFTRGISQFRSFHCALPSKQSGQKEYTLVVKGGDLLNTEGVATHLTQLKDGFDIPGSATEKESVVEFDAALVLQRRALRKLGRLTYVPVPIAVREIDRVPQKDGSLIDVRSFMNSPEYAIVPPHLAAYLDIGTQTGVGDVAYDRYGLRPTEYLYLTDGPNVRVNEPYDLLQGTHKLSPIQANAMVRNVYAMLGKGYTFEVSDLFPQSQEINDDERKRLLEQNSSGTSERVLQTFVERITEVAALAHGMGYTFMNRERDSGGSMTSRNTTCFGVVCDLESFRPFTLGEEEQDVLGDFKHMVMTIGIMRKLFPTTNVSHLAKYIVNTYIEKLQQMGENPASVQQIVGMVSNPSLLIGMQAVL